MCGLAQKNGAFLIVQRQAGGSQGLKWEFPGGKVEPGESPQEALAREWNEELGLTVTVGALHHKTTFSNGPKDYELQAWEVELGPGSLELRDHLQATWVPVSELLSYDLSDSDRKIAQFLVASD